MCVYIPFYLCVRVSICRPFVSLYTTHSSTRAVPAHSRAGGDTRARIGGVRRRRTGGDECGAEQQCGVAGADRVGVEVRSVGAGHVVAAPRAGRVGAHERERRRRTRNLARGGDRGAARRLGLDPRGARRALVAARGTGHVRACATKYRMGVPNRPYSGPPKCRVPSRLRAWQQARRTQSEWPPTRPTICLSNHSKTLSIYLSIPIHRSIYKYRYA